MKLIVSCQLFKYRFNVYVCAIKYFPGSRKMDWIRLNKKAFFVLLISGKCENKGHCTNFSH